MLFTGCEKDDENRPALSLSVESMQFPSAGGTRSVAVHASGSWLLENENEVFWCKTNISGDDVSFTVTANSTPDERTATYRFSCEGSIVELTVKQAQLGILTAGSSYSIGAAGGNIDVRVETNVQYDVSIPANDREWLSVSSSRATHTETLRFAVGENPSASARSSSVELKDNTGLRAVIVITQRGNVPRNQILYTSTDGGKVVPSSAKDTFGPGFTIVSNTYFDGQGAITFDGDITASGRQSVPFMQKPERDISTRRNNRDRRLCLPGMRSADRHRYSRKRDDRRHIRFLLLYSPDRHRHTPECDVYRGECIRRMHGTCPYRDDRRHDQDRGLRFPKVHFPIRSDDPRQRNVDRAFGIFRVYFFGRNESSRRHNRNRRGSVLRLHRAAFPFPKACKK